MPPRLRGRGKPAPSFVPSVPIHNCGPEDWVLFLGEPEWVDTHWSGSHSIPCMKPLEGVCRKCAKGYSLKPIGYAAAIVCPKDLGQGVSDDSLSFQPCVFSLPGVKPIVKQFGQSLAKKLFRCWRVGKGNSPVKYIFAELVKELAEVPVQAFDPLAILEAIWFPTDESLLAVQEIVRGLPPAYDLPRSVLRPAPKQSRPVQEKLSEEERRAAHKRLREEMAARELADATPVTLTPAQREEQARKLKEYWDQKAAGRAAGPDPLDQLEQQQREANERKRKGEPPRDALEALLMGQQMRYVAGHDATAAAGRNGEAKKGGVI